MADVSVEFGAKDTGLENALKTVQDELTRLDEKVKGGELSFKELESSMKRIAQVEKLQDQLESMADSTKKAGDAADVAAPKARELGDGMQDAGNKAQNAGGLFDSSFAKIAGAFTVGNIAAKAFEKIIQTAFDVARAAAQGFSDALDLGGRLDDLSKRTGETAGKLLVLENAFIEAGVSADQVGTVINKLQNFMVDAANGGDKQTAAMNKLGISLTELEGKTPTEQIGVFAKAISGIEDPTQRAAVASDVFGEKLGGKLLPLLTEFTPALDNSRRSVGSLEQIMDENAATFAAAGDTIDRVKGKMAAFAAGIMSETLPALKDLGTAMEGVDAAGLGRQIGQQLNPALTAAADAAKIVNILLDKMGSAAAGAANEITKTKEGSNFLALALVALQNQLNPAIGASNQFKAVLKLMGEESVSATDAQKNTASAIKATGEAAVEAKPKLDALPGAGEKLNLEFENLPKTIESTFPLIGEFKANLDDAAPSVTAIGTETGVVKSDFSEISSLTLQLPGQNDAFTQSILGTNEQLNLQPGIYAEVFQGISEAQAKEEERRVAMEQAANKLQASVELQIQLNEAIASGNVKEQARVQKLIDAEAAQKRIKELTDQYIATGLGEKEAGQLATNLVNSEIAAANVKKNSEGMKGELGGANKEAQTVKGLMDEIANAKMEASPERLKERTKDARKELKDMRDFIGQDLSQMPLDDIIDKLGLDPDGKLKTADEKLRAVEGAVKDIGGADPADITPDVDLVGVNDQLEKVKGYLAGIEKDKADATPKIDQESIKNQVATSSETIKKDLEKIKAEVKVKPKLDKEALKEEVDMAFASSKGTQHLSNIDKLVETIKGFVEKIEGKLPLQALAY